MNTTQNAATLLTDSINIPEASSPSARLRPCKPVRFGTHWLQSLLFGGLLSLSSPFLTPAGAQASAGAPPAPQTVQSTVEFKTTNQSMWGPNCPHGASANFNLSTSWNTGTVGGSDYKDPKIGLIHLGDFGGEATAYSNGSAGLSFSAQANAGSVNVDYLCNITLTPPTVIQAGQPFTIGSSYTYWGALSTQSPNASVSMGGVLNFNAGVTVKAKFFGDTVFNVSPSVNLDTNPNLLTIDSSLLDNNIDINQLGIVSGSGHAPTINTEGICSSVMDANGQWLNNPLTSAGSDDFLNINGDITRLITTILESVGIEMPPLKDNSNKTKSIFGKKWGIDAGYNLCDLYGNVSLTEGQDFTFFATPTIHLTFYWDGRPQMTASFPAGQSFTGTLPAAANGKTVKVLGMVDLSQNNLLNNTYLSVHPGLYFLPLDVYFDAYADGDEFVDADLQPVGPIDVVGMTQSFSIFSQAFPLGGFTSQGLPEFAMNVGN
jgi:hypothetical protein